MEFIKEKLNMVFVRSFQFNNMHIDKWRGKYSKKKEIIFTVGNVKFNSLDEAKAWLLK